MSSNAAKEKQFQQYCGIARKIASRFSKSYHRPYAEMVDIAEYALAIILFGENDYDEKKGTMSTYLWNKIYWYLKEVCTRGNHPKGPIKEWQPGEKLQDQDEFEEVIPCRQPSWTSKILQELSEEGAALVHTLCEAPEELKQGVSWKAPQRTKKMVRDYLIDERDWDELKFITAWDEVARVVTTQS